MPQLTDSDLIQVLHLLLHELRSPVGIAQGYLRLMTEGSLQGEDERRRALQRSLEALGRVGALCQDADAFMDALETADTKRWPAGTLVDALRAHGVREGFEVYGSVTSGLDFISGQTPAETAVSLAVVLGLPSKAPGQPVTVAAGETHLVIASGDAEDRTKLVDSAARVPLDAWKAGRGLSVVVAAQRLSTIGARLWSLPERAAAAVEIPLENTHDGSVGHRR